MQTKKHGERFWPGRERGRSFCYTRETQFSKKKKKHKEAESSQERQKQA